MMKFLFFFKHVSPYCNSHSWFENPHISVDVFTAYIWENYKCILLTSYCIQLLSEQQSMFEFQNLRQRTHLFYVVESHTSFSLLVFSVLFSSSSISIASASSWARRSLAFSASFSEVREEKVIQTQW